MVRPRGLASVVFTLIAFEDLHGAGPIADAIVEIATWTILLSVVAHGLSAGPSHRHTATACTRRATSQSSPRLRSRGSGGGVSPTETGLQHESSTSDDAWPSKGPEHDGTG